MRWAGSGHKMASRLKLVQIQKSFGATHALRGVSLEVGAGEAHALIGENGAGKSTLMKILSGAHEMDAGHMWLDGEPYAPRNPIDARRRGVAMIYQELNLAPHLSVEENMVLGREPSKYGFLDKTERRRQVASALAELDSNIDPASTVSHLTVAQQQLVEIARALMLNPRVLILDEPTSSLTAVEVDRLFAVLARLRDRGVSILYISHFLEECQQVCSRFTVLRDGESVFTGVLAQTSLSEIIRAMVGRDVSELYPRSERTNGRPLLKIRSVSGREKPRDINLTVHAGEVLGLFGLIGAGRTELLRVIFGLDPMVSGEVSLDGHRLPRATPPRSLRAGMALLSEDRKQEGLLLNRSIAENLLITRPADVSSYGFIRPGSERYMSLDWMEHLGVRALSEQQRVGELSGGNQQKVAFGRLLYHQALVLLLDEPTRGIDVGSKVAIYRRIEKAADQGRGILLVSSYIPELLGVCDSIAVFCRGTLVAQRPVREWDEHSLMVAAIGQDCVGEKGGGREKVGVVKPRGSSDSEALHGS